MSTLQWSLAILAAAVVALVIGLNVWQASRGRRRLREASASVAARAEGRAARIEPTIAPLVDGAALPAGSPPPADRAAPSGEPGMAATGPGRVFTPAGGAEAGRARGATPPAATAATASATATTLAAAGRPATPGSSPDAAAAASSASSAVVGAPASEALPTTAGAPAAADARHVPLNPQIDCLIEIELQTPQPGERLLAATRGLRRVGSKPVQFEGHEVASSEWRPIEPTQAYGALRCGVLLANRHGPLNAMEFSELAASLQPVAEQLDSLVHLPDMSAVLDRARQVDARCAELDAQVGLNIESPEPPTVADLQACAEASGLAERGNNLYARLDAEGAVLFSLALGDTANRLTLLLDVPRAPATQDPWRQMVDCAVTCAAQVGGRIVDDSGRPLDLAALERIEEQLAQRWAALERAGIPAGSPAALRLFN